MPGAWDADERFSFVPPCCCCVTCSRSAHRQQVLSSGRFVPQALRSASAGACRCCFARRSFSALFFRVSFCREEG